MPNVKGKKYPYTKKGKAAAKKAAKQEQEAKPKSMLKRTPAAGKYSRGF